MSFYANFGGLSRGFWCPQIARSEKPRHRRHRPVSHFDPDEELRRRYLTPTAPATTPTVGKLVKVESSVSTTEYTGFDILGRVTAHKQTTDGNEYTTGYTYSLNGALLEQTYPSGRVVKNTYDMVDGSISQVQSKRSSETYRNFANGFIYNPAGAVTAMRLGNGKWENTVFNSRLQPTQIGLGNGVNSQNLLKLEYSYGTTENNGNVLSQTITVPGVTHPFIQNYTYDELNRLKIAEETQNSTQTWKQTFTFDRYGNRNFDEANTTFAGFDKLCSGNTVLCSDLKKRLNPSINTSNNRLSTSDDYAFDASGNTASDPDDRTFIYDAENKQVEVKDSLNATIGQYFYDGDGRRVKKVVPGGDTTVFVYDAGGKLIGEYSSIVQTGSIAKTVYTTNDHLGSPRINTDGTGQVISRHDYHPFGEEIARTGYGSDTIRKQFTGYERDGETGLDFAQARYYAKSLGRFHSADEPFVDQIEDDPQSWNLYLYVRNNPLNLVDPLGSRADCPPGSIDGCYERDGKFYVRGEDGSEIYLENPLRIHNSDTVVSAPDNKVKDMLKGAQPTLEIWQPVIEAVTPTPIPGGALIGGLSKLGRIFKPVVGVFRTAPKVRASLPVLQKLCFVAGTPILTRGGVKPIEEVREGDEVLSYNEKTKQNEFKTVVRTFERFAEAGRILSVKVEGEAEPLGVTDEHPFYVRIHRARDNTTSEDDGEWIEAGDLKVGGEIRKADGTWARVESFTRRSGGEKVYNFEVADNHNYFVGDTYLLAHNNCLPAITKAVNSNLQHAIKRAVQHSATIGSPMTKESAGQALRELSEQITKNGLPAGSIADTARADRVLVPLGNGLLASYQIAKNGTAKLKTVLIAK